jgi:hypothetical protein
MTVALEVGQLHLFMLLIVIKLLNVGLGALALVEVLVDNSSLRLAKADEIDQVGEDFNEAEMCRLVNILEREIVDAAL